MFIDATTANQFAVQGDSIRMNFFMNNRLGADVKLKDILFENFDLSFGRPLDKNKNFQRKNISKFENKDYYKPLLVKRKHAGRIFYCKRSN